MTADVGAQIEAEARAVIAPVALTPAALVQDVIDLAVQVMVAERIRSDVGRLRDMHQLVGGGAIPPLSPYLLKSDKGWLIQQKIMWCKRLHVQIVEASEIRRLMIRSRPSLRSRPRFRVHLLRKGPTDKAIQARVANENSKTAAGRSGINEGGLKGNALTKGWPPHSWLVCVRQS